MEEHGYTIGNIDCTIIAEKPKLSPHKVRGGDSVSVSASACLGTEPRPLLLLDPKCLNHKRGPSWPMRTNDPDDLEQFAAKHAAGRAAHIADILRHIWQQSAAAQRSGSAAEAVKQAACPGQIGAWRPCTAVYAQEDHLPASQEEMR